MRKRKGFRAWIRKGLGPRYGSGAVSTLLSRLSRKGLARLRHRYRKRLPFDPRLTLGTGNLAAYGAPHGYLGRSVVDLGDRHAHGIIDIPWRALRVNYRGKFDPWKHAVRGRGELLAVRHPRPRDRGERAIIEAAITVPNKVYRQLRQSGEFEVLRDGVLARRGRKMKATNIFVVPR